MKATTAMKAIRVHEYGGADVLRYEDTPRPAPGKGQVLVRVCATGVNPVDCQLRTGELKGVVPLPLPWIPGNDFSGVVVGAGPGVTGVSVGDEVFGRTDLCASGTYSEYLVVERSALASKPQTLDHVHAAAVPGAALAAWQALFGDACEQPSLALRSGQTLLILGAAGGIGSFALQFAQWKGARVLASTRHPGQTERLRALGADTVIHGHIDAVLNLGGELAHQTWPYVEQQRASVLGTAPESDPQALGAETPAGLGQAISARLRQIAGLIDAGMVQVTVDQTMPLREASLAHQLIEGGTMRGKVVLKVAHA